MFQCEILVVKNEDRSADPSCNPRCTVIRDLKAPYMVYMNVGLQENFSTVNIQADPLKDVLLENVSRHRPQKVLNRTITPF